MRKRVAERHPARMEWREGSRERRRRRGKRLERSEKGAKKGKRRLRRGRKECGATRKPRRLRQRKRSLGASDFITLSTHQVSFCVQKESLSLEVLLQMV